MRIAVTCTEQETIENLAEAELFRIYEIENGSIKDSELVRTINAGHRIIAPFLADKSVEALICGKIDKQAKRIYSRHGLLLYPEQSGPAEQIVKNFLSGQFKY